MNQSLPVEIETLTLQMTDSAMRNQAAALYQTAQTLLVPPPPLIGPLYSSVFGLQDVFPVLPQSLNFVINGILKIVDSSTVGRALCARVCAACAACVRVLSLRPLPDVFALTYMSQTLRILRESALLFNAPLLITGRYSLALSASGVAALARIEAYDPVRDALPSFDARIEALPMLTGYTWRTSIPGGVAA